MSAAKLGIFVGLGELTCEGDVGLKHGVGRELLQARFHLTTSDNSELCLDSAFKKDFYSSDGMVDAFVRRQARDGDEAQGFIEGFGLQLGNWFQIDAVMNDRNFSAPTALQGSFG